MLLAVGFAVAAWLTAALLSSAAHAAEPPTAEQIAAEVEREVQEDVSTSLPGDPATAEVPPVLDAAALPPEQADPPTEPTPEPAEAAEPATPAAPAVPDLPAVPGSNGEPDAAPAPSRALLGTLTDTVGTLAGTVTDTLGGITGSLERTTPILDLPAPELRLPPALLPALPVLPTLPSVPTLPEPGDSVGIAVPEGELPGAGLPGPAVPQPDAPDQQTSQPQPARSLPVTVTAADGTPAVPATEPAAPVAPREIVAGGGAAPAGVPAPLPAAPTGTGVTAQVVASAHHDHAGGRAVHGILSWEPTQAQLRLAGTSREHDVDGAGRQAALPTTTPD